MLHASCLAQNWSTARRRAPVSAYTASRSVTPLVVVSENFLEHHVVPMVSLCELLVLLELPSLLEEDIFPRRPQPLPVLRARFGDELQFVASERLRTVAVQIKAHADFPAIDLLDLAWTVPPFATLDADESALVE